MGTTNFGNQNNVFRYQSPADSQVFNRLYYGVLDTGIYSGGLIEKVNNIQIRVNPFKCIIQDVTNNVAVKVDTQETALISILPTQTVVVLRFVWFNTDNNYLDVLSVPINEVLANDLIIGRVEFDNSTLLETFDYSERSIPNITTVQPGESLRLIPTTPYSNQVSLTSGTILLTGQVVEVPTQTSSSFITPSSDSRYSAITLDENGLIKTYDGGESATPEKPSYPAEEFLVGYILLSSTDTKITGSNIEQEKIDIYYSPDDILTENETNVIVEYGAKVHTIKAGTTINGSEFYTLENDYDIVFGGVGAGLMSLPLPVPYTGFDIYYINYLHGDWYAVGHLLPNGFSACFKTTDYGENWTFLWEDKIGSFTTRRIEKLYEYGNGVVGYVLDVNFTDRRFRYWTDFEANIYTDISLSVESVSDTLAQFVHNPITGISILRMDQGYLFVCNEPTLTSWVKVTTLPSIIVRDIVYGSSNFICVFFDSPYIFTSADGITWTGVSDDFGTLTNSNNATSFQREDTLSISIYSSPFERRDYVSSTGTDGSFSLNWTAKDVLGLTPKEYRIGEGYLILAEAGGSDDVIFFNENENIPYVSKSSIPNYTVFDSDEKAMYFSVNSFAAPWSITEVYSASWNPYVQIGYSFKESTQAVVSNMFKETVLVNGKETIYGDITLTAFRYLFDDNNNTNLFTVYGGGKKQELTKIIQNNISTKSVVLPDLQYSYEQSQFYGFSIAEEIITDDVNPKIENRITNILHSQQLDDITPGNFYTRYYKNRESVGTSGASSGYTGHTYFRSVSFYYKGEIHTIYLRHTNNSVTSNRVGSLEAEGGNSVTLPNPQGYNLDHRVLDIAYDDVNDKVYAALGQSYVEVDYDKDTRTLGTLTHTITNTDRCASGNGLFYGGEVYFSPIPNLAGSIMVDVVFCRYDNKFYFINNRTSIVRTSDLINYEQVFQGSALNTLIVPNRDTEFPVFFIGTGAFYNQRFDYGFTIDDFSTLSEAFKTTFDYQPNLPIPRSGALKNHFLVFNFITDPISRTMHSDNKNFDEYTLQITDNINILNYT